MAKIFEVRYKIDGIVVAHQHAAEHLAKIDAKQVSKTHGKAVLGEIDASNDNLIRICEFAGGVQDKWENRTNKIKPCKILLTIEETKEVEQSSLETKPKVEYTDEEKEQKKAALAAIREAQRVKEIRPASKTAVSPEIEKKQKLVAKGHEPALADLICKSNVHVDSPNYIALVELWKGPVTEKDFPGMKQKDLNTFMLKLRTLLISNETGKAIITKNTPQGLSYRLADFKLEIIEEVA